MTNQMGDVISITDAQGNELAEYEYDEWGKLILTRADNQLNESIANINPIRYRGYYYDTETGYYYLQSRYYDPSICRFINSNIAEIAGMSKGISAGTNLFGYCNNNPVNDSDPTGNISFSQLKTAFNNAMNLLKNAIKKILKKVGIWKSGSYLYIKTSLLAGAIDTIIFAGSAVKAVAVKSVFKVAVKFIKSNEKNFIKFLKNTLFPYISNNMTSVINFCVKAFATSFGLRLSSTLVKGAVSNALFGNFKIYKWYSAFSSAGNIIANIFDIITDLSWNGKIRIKVRK